jgi:hypothetical protein
MYPLLATIKYSETSDTLAELAGKTNPQFVTAVFVGADKDHSFKPIKGKIYLMITRLASIQNAYKLSYIILPLSVQILQF